MPAANIAFAGSTAIKWRVGLAALLGGALLALPASAAPPPTPNADPTFPFAREIDAFARASSAGPPVRDATLFLGSSSIRLWDIAGSFADIATVNRGFGGATTAHVLHYYKRLLPALPPRAVIVYVGENDLAAGASPDQVARAVTGLLGRLRADYPRAHIAFLSLKPSPIRWTLRPKMQAVNAAVAARAAAQRVACLDAGSALLAPDGLPDASLFRADGLHLNPRGYRRWTALVERWLDSLPPPPAPRQSAARSLSD